MRQPKFFHLPQNIQKMLIQANELAFDCYKGYLRHSNDKFFELYVDTVGTLDKLIKQFGL